MPDVTIDKRVLKALSSDARIDLLRALQERRKTITELAEEFSHSKSTVHEHLLKLLDANLVQKNENYTEKFVYYELTSQGERILETANQPMDSLNTRIILMIALTSVLIVGLYGVFFYFNPPTLTQSSLVESSNSDTRMYGISVPDDSLSRPTLPDAETTLEKNPNAEQESIGTAEQLTTQTPRDYNSDFNYPN